MTRSKYLPLIQAKLHRPAVGRQFVNRARLNALLNRGLDGPLSLVCAPAGFGKTMAVSAWIDSLNAHTAVGGGLPSAWLTLDERDGDLTVFLHYFIAALRTIFPDACAETTALLTEFVQPDLDRLVATLSNEITALPRRFILVLDDNVVADNRSIYALLGQLLRDCPPPLHLTLIGRREPPLPLASLRAKGQITEIRAGDLRFTREEIRAYVNLRLAEDPDPAFLDRLERATEGWITGLLLVVRTLPVSDDSEVGHVLSVISVAHVTDYLFDEVLAAQPQPVRDFLLKTAILDRFSASLAAAVIGREEPGCDAGASHAAECIAWIERADLFVSRQDEQGEWYRCHLLFKEMLLRRLRNEFSPQQVNGLHERAAGWFAARGELDEALHHALTAANLDLAARLVEQGLCDVLNRHDPPTLMRWLHLLPEEFIQSRPGLLLVKAWVQQFSWQLAAQARAVDQAEALLAADAGQDPGEPESDPRILRGQIAAFRAQQAYWANQQDRALALCRESLALMPQTWTYVRGAAALYEALAMWVRGDGDRVVHLLSERYALSENKTDLYSLRLLVGLCFVWHQAGQLERMRQTAQVMLEQAQRSNLAFMRSWAQYFFGVVHYERCETEQAGAPLSHLMEHQHTIFMAILHDSFALMALVFQAQGALERAMHLADRLRELDIERLGDESDDSRSLRARLLLLEGEVEEAGRWADTFTQPLPERPMLWIANPHLTRARILIARNRGADVTTALDVLAALLDFAGRTHSTPVQIEALALRSLALYAVRRPDEALDALRQALDLCHPGDFTRVFVDLGPHMTAMLRRLATDGCATETIRQILSAAARPGSGAASTGNDPGGALLSSVANAALIEPLTPRELEVLDLLRGNLSDKEIARRLFLSPLTVKRHKANIFGKLGAHRRADAVIQAEMLGLLTTDA